MVFRRLRKRGRDRAGSSERRRLGKAFQKDGPTTAKLLRWAVASLTLQARQDHPAQQNGETCGPAEMIPGHRAPLDNPGPWCRVVWEYVAHLVGTQMWIMHLIMTHNSK